MEKNIIFFMPSFEGGGVEKNIILIANYFSKRNKSIFLITSSKKIENKFNAKIKIITPKYNFWDKFGRAPKYFVCSYLLIKTFLLKSNLKVFCFQGNILCTILCKILNLKIVIRPNSSPSGWSKNIIKKFIFKKVLSYADEIIVNSLKFKLELKSKLKLNSKCIYNPLNINQIKKLSNKRIKLNFYKKKSLNIISIGRLVYQKDHITLLKAINLIKKKINLKLLIIGEGDQKKNLRSFINKNKLNNIVKIKNRIDNPYPYIKKSDLLILSSIFEGLPNVILEGLVLKKFIISSNCPTGPDEILDSGKGGYLFKVGDYKQLSEKILKFKKNKNEVKKLKKHANKRINRFNMIRNLNNYYKIVSKI